MNEEKCIIRYICLVDGKEMKALVCHYDEAIKTIELIRHMDNITIKDLGEEYDGNWKLFEINLVPSTHKHLLQCIEVYLDYEEEVI